MDLDRNECAVLRAMLDWLNPNTMTLFPSVKTIAARVKMTDRGTWGIIRRLIDRGIVEIVNQTKGGRARSGRGYSNTYKLHLPGFEYTPNYEPGSYLDPNSPTVELRTPPQSSTNAATGKYERGSYKASSHPVGEPTRNAATPNADARGAEFIPGGMLACPSPSPSSLPSPGSHRSTAQRPHDLRCLLIDCGIRGPNLDRLAETKLPLEKVISTAERLKADPTVRNFPAVLAATLATEADITFGAPRNLSREELDAITKIEQRRRECGTSGGSNPTIRDFRNN